jgi:hypothetical protein
LTEIPEKKSVFDPETGLSLWRHAVEDIGTSLRMVLYQDACCKASFVAGIARDKRGVIRGFVAFS